MPHTDEIIFADMAARLSTLTPREVEVLIFTAKGMGHKQISRLLPLTRNTIQTCRQRIYRKLNVSSSEEAAVIAAKVGLV